jgi:hypothetical protein
MCRDACGNAISPADYFDLGFTFGAEGRSEPEMLVVIARDCDGVGAVAPAVTPN